MHKYPVTVFSKLLAVGVFLTPLLALADLGAVTNPPANVTALLNKISEVIINPLIYMMFTAGFVVFIWGLVQFVAHLDNEEARATGGKHMLWGIIGMVIMVGVVGIVNIIQNTIRSIGG